MQNLNEIIYQLNKLYIEYTIDEQLANHTSIKLGGSAKIYVLPKNVYEMMSLIKLCKNFDTDYYILGKGTNTLFADDGFCGVVISTIKLTEFKVVENRIFASAGLGLFDLGKVCAKNALSGIEFAYGIPGSVGGAMVTNAGAFEKCLGDYVDYILAIRDDKVVKLAQQDMQFGYRKSVLQKENSVVAGVMFKLKKGEPEQIKKLQNSYFEKKLASQPYDKLSLGSVFKRNTNYPPVSKLIDQLNLKGYTIGGASVSTKHAGFLINNGDATCKDFVLLIQYVQEQISKNFGFTPELEIRLAGDINATFWGLSHSHKI